MSENDNEKAREARLRRALRRKGYVLRKSRIRSPNERNFGDYRITYGEGGCIVDGASFDLTLDDVERFAMAENVEEAGA